MKVISMDTETRGMYGKIFLGGWYDGTNYQTFNTGLEFMSQMDNLLLQEEDEEVHVIVFNLDFDLGKLLRECSEHYRKTGEELFRIDYKNSLIIHNRFHTAKIQGKKLVFHDIFKLVNCSLDKACKDFGLSTKKQELPTTDKGQYFETVSSDDATLREYLRCDVVSTYELYRTLLDLSGLGENDFLRCPTIASLSMKIYRTRFPDEFAMIQDTWLTKEAESFIRSAYCGGRTEIFRNLLDDKGYHYDINSLYPHVMEVNQYPIGNPRFCLDGKSQEEKLEFFHAYRRGEAMIPVNYILEATVHVPKSHVAPLPYRKGGLLFPVGTFRGTFCSPEMEFALEHFGVEILEIHKLLCFRDEAFLFDRFVAEQKLIKNTSQGAKRTFSKLIQNSLYGKFGMARKREAFALYTPKKEQELKKKGALYAVVKGMNDTKIISWLTSVTAHYIKPHLSAFITSYARVELLKKLMAIPPDALYYCDTDSIVTTVPLPDDEVHVKDYGKWKLEKELRKAIFVLPKLYAELGIDGEEILKSKGLVREYRTSVRYADYEQFFDSMIKNVNLPLYGYSTGLTYYQRHKLMTAIKQGKDIDEQVRVQKALLFSMIRYKRVYDYNTNTSAPIEIDSG